MEKQKIYRLILFELVMILSFTVVSYPQKAAEKKYFGHDYMIVNILAMLSDVMRDDNYHTDYEGFESDIQAVEALYDPTMIKEWRSVAFQFTNMLKGNHPNRSMASEEEQEAFIKGSVGILLHNKIPLMKGRIHMSMEALSLMPENDSFGNTTVSNLEEIDENLTVVSGEGEKLLFEKGILPGEIRDTLKGIWQVIYAVSMSVLQPITSGLLLILFFTMIALCIEMLIKKRWFFLFTGLYILSMVGVIVVFEPAAREAYYYPVYYQAILFLLFYFALVEHKELECISGMQEEALEN